MKYEKAAKRKNYQALSRNEMEIDFRAKQLRARRNVTGTYKTRLGTRDY